MKLWSVYFCLFVGIFVFFHFSHAASLNIDASGFNLSFPGPELLSPTTDDIDLKGEPYIEFKWRRIDFVYTQDYDFRLYKGYQAVASNLILKRRVSIDEYPIKVESLVFDLNQVYTWVLRQVTFDGSKSDKSSSSFRILKK